MSSISKRKKSTTSALKANTRITKPDLMMCWAEDAAYRSTCDRLMVGCVITDASMKKVRAYGYNGNYAGGPNKCDRKKVGDCGCIHAEVNALIKAEIYPGDHMFLTDAPCLSCAKLIINAGIYKLYYSRDYRKSEGLELLKANIQVEKII